MQHPADLEVRDVPDCSGDNPVIEIVMWILLLPWALAYLVWESSWDHWLRVLVVVQMATAHLMLSAPRPKPGER